MKNLTYDLVEEVGDKLVSMFVAKTIQEMMGWYADDDLDKNVDGLADSIVDEIVGNDLDVFIASNIRPLIDEYTKDLSKEELVLVVNTISDAKEQKQIVDQISRKFNEESLDAEWQRQLTKLN